MNGVVTNLVGGTTDVVGSTSLVGGQMQGYEGSIDAYGAPIRKKLDLVESNGKSMMVLNHHSGQVYQTLWSPCKRLLVSA